MTYKDGGDYNSPSSVRPHVRLQIKESEKGTEGESRGLPER